jgi:hypothetical protein
LHLFGVLEQDTKPRTDTFLQLLWPLVEAQFAAHQNGSMSTQKENLVAADGITTRRLPMEWSPPEPQQTTAVGVLQDVVGTTPLHPEFAWAGETARHIGTLVHREIERIAGGVDSNDSALNAQRYAIELAELGVPPHLREAAVARVIDALTKMWSDERGRWLLMGAGSSEGAHREASSELALSGLVGSNIVNGIIDRTFVAADGTRWIVDFKTSAHEGGGGDEFLANEVERYRPQLQRYATLMRSYRPNEPIKAGLYFPLLKAWREVPL